MEDKLHRLKARAKLIAAVREFFSGHGFLEVDTPVRIHAPAPETHIDAVPSGGEYLRTSPELQMKTMLAAGYGPIFQIGPCFRLSETGRLHREEFTMLEWYQPGIDYMRLADFTREMLIHAIRAISGSARCRFAGHDLDFAAEWHVATVHGAFAEFAGISPEEALGKNIYEETLVEKVEPSLPQDRPVILKDYPASLAAFARLSRQNPAVAERWELYLGGVEIANAYGELTDPAEQKRRFAKFAEERKAAGKPVYPFDADFLDAISRGIPDCSGCALGIDRLAMVMTGADRIGDLMWE
jgi:lysyl-tRNA synthetase class 2